MAINISATLEGNDLEKINLNISGTFSDTIVSTSLEVLTPDGDSIVVNLYATNFSIPIVPQVRVITPVLLGLNEFIDGVYSLKYTVNYASDPSEVTDFSSVLFNNVVMNKWIDLMEEHITINCVYSNAPEVRKRSESREMIEAANEFFLNGRFNEAKLMLEGALDLITN